MNQMMNPNVDITLVIRKSADGRMAVSVLPKSNTLKDEAQNSIVPLTLNGTPEEETKLKESYAHLCKLRDEVIEMGVLPAIKDWHSINPNID